MNTHKHLLAMFYFVFVVILAMKNKQVLYLKPIDIVWIGFAIVALLLVAYKANRQYYEHFEESTTDVPTVTVTDNAGADLLEFPSQPSTDTPSVSQPTDAAMQDAQEEVAVINKDHTDLLISEAAIYAHNVVFYFSCFHWKSFDFANKKWKDLNNQAQSLQIKSSSDIFGILQQREGIDISNAQLVGFESSKLRMSDNMRQFSIFFYAKFDIPTNVKAVYNLIEIFSSNVIGNIALSVKIQKESETDKKFKLLVNFAGLTYFSTIQYENIFDNNTDGVFSIIKRIANGVHSIEIRWDDIVLFNQIINYDEIKYISTNVDSILLSRENFVINKGREGSDTKTVNYKPLNARVYNIGMLNISIDDQTIKNISKNLKYQQDTQLHPEVNRLTNELSEAHDHLHVIQQTMQDLSRCKLSSEVCEKCEGVDWSNFESFTSSPACVEAMTNKCRDIKNGAVSAYTSYEKSICASIQLPDESECQMMYPNLEKKSSSSNGDDLNIKTIEVDASNRDAQQKTETDNASASTCPLQTNTGPPVVPDSQLVVPTLDPAQRDGVTSDNNDDQLFSTNIMDTKLSGSDYAKLLENTEKDVYNQAKKLAEDQVKDDGDASPNMFMKFVNYMLPTKTP